VIAHRLVPWRVIGTEQPGIERRSPAAGAGGEGLDDDMLSEAGVLGELRDGRVPAAAEVFESRAH